VVPKQCERSRELASLELDGLLSTFEAALLDRHLSRCPSCHAFATQVSAQTHLLRSTAFERLPQPILVAQATGQNIRRRATGLAVAVSVAALAALLILTPTLRQRDGGRVASAATSRTLLAVFPADPRVNATFDVPRLRVVSPAIADGAVRGYYGVPV